MSHRTVLIVGAGLTGSVVAFELRRLFAKAIGDGRLSVAIWEANRDVGGRMRTAHAAEDPRCQADVGAQYFSISKEHRTKFASVHALGLALAGLLFLTPRDETWDESHKLNSTGRTGARKRFYDELEKNGLLEGMNAPIEGGNPFSGDDVEDRICPHGTSAVVQHFLKQSGLAVCSNRALVGVDRGLQQKITATSRSGDLQNLDWVILTIPVPHIFQLRGSAVSSPAFEALKQQNPVEYSSRYALALFFPQLTELGLPFGFKYIEDKILRYIAVDNIKRNRKHDPAAVVLHSSWQFGRDHIEDSEEVAEELMLDRFYQLFPNVPRTDSRQVQKWKHSQLKTREKDREPPGIFELCPGVLCAGDGFTWSSLDGCFESAMQVSSFLEKKFGDFI